MAGNELDETDMSKKTEKESVKTNWVVITGGPSSGKTTTINDLKARGFPIVLEAARQLEEEELKRGKSIVEARGGDEIEFNHRVLDKKMENEDHLNPNDSIFLDRGIPDTIAYARYYKEDETYAKEASLKRRYKAVFVLDPLPKFEEGKGRIEDVKFTQKMGQLLPSIYMELGYEAIIVPVFSEDQGESVRLRSEFILSHLSLPKNKS